MNLFNRDNSQDSKKMSRLRILQNPIVFQGNLHKKRYFEGWYYKICSIDENRIFAIIPGVALHKNQKKSHAFIQVLNGNTAEYEYLRFPLHEFKFWRQKHRIQIGPNIFSENGLFLDLKLANNVSMKGELKFSSNIPIKSNKFSPGIMGPLSYLPFLETYHGIVSMNHAIQGNLVYKNHEIPFSGGKGYIEKDWGRSFPSNWIWMQSNHFTEEKRSFVFSIATIPYLGLNFRGFFAVFWDRGQEFRFTSYNGAKINTLKITDTEVSFNLTGKNKGIELNIHAFKPEKYNNSSTSIMMTPQNGGMVSKCAETMKATIEIIFKSPTINLFDKGINAGCEIMAKMGNFKYNNNIII